MKFKGDYSGGTSYSVGDAVRYTDGVIYHLQNLCDAGTPPVNTLFWGRVNQMTAEAIIALADYVKDAADAAEAAAKAAIPDNINGEAITLKGSASGSTSEYLITVDDSGDTPELDVTLIEPEAEAEGGGT